MISEVTIHEFPRVRLAGLLHRGDYAKMGEAFERLSNHFEEGALWGYVEGAAGVGHDNPRSTPVDKLRSHACFVVGEDFPLAAPLEEIVYAPARCAVMQVRGPYEQLGEAYRLMAEDWYPASGETLLGPVPYEVYLNDPSQVKEEDLLTEIRWPLRGADEAGS